MQEIVQRSRPVHAKQRGLCREGGASGARGVPRRSDACVGAAEIVPGDRVGRHVQPAAEADAVAVQDADLRARAGEPRLPRALRPGPGRCGQEGAWQRRTARVAPSSPSLSITWNEPTTRSAGDDACSRAHCVSCYMLLAPPDHGLIVAKQIGRVQTACDRSRPHITRAKTCCTARGHGWARV